MEEFYKEKLFHWIRDFWGFILVFIIAFTIRCVAMETKTVMFIDDPFTFVSSAPNNLNPEGKPAKIAWDNYNFEKGKIYTGKQIKTSLFSMDSSFNSILKDLKTIRSQNIERQHPTLYYSIFRIWGAGLNGLNYYELINRGCLLNFVFFIFSFFFLYKLLALIKDDKKFISLGLFFGFVSFGSISNFLLIRPYALQECLFILVSYISVLILKKIESAEKINTKEIFLYSLSFSLFLLSGYFATIYTAIIFVFYMIATLVKKRYDLFKSLLLIAVLGTLLTVTFYPGYFDFHTNNEHIDTVLNNFTNLKIHRFFKIICWLSTRIKANILYPVCMSLVLCFIILGTIFFGKNNFLFFDDEYTKSQKNIILGLLVFCFIWSFISIYITPYMQFRYIAPSSAIFALILTVLAYRMKKNVLWIILYAYLCLSVMQVLHPRLIKDIETFKINSRSEIPVVVANNLWYNVNYFILLGDNQKILFEDSEETPNIKFKKYILFSKKINPKNSELLERVPKQKMYLINNK